jgi:hypothetical protein
MTSRSCDDDDDWWPESWPVWLDAVSHQVSIEVEVTEPEPVGGLWLMPGDHWHDIYPERPSFGFGRFLDG